MQRSRAVTTAGTDTPPVPPATAARLRHPAFSNRLAMAFVSPQVTAIAPPLRSLPRRPLSPRRGSAPGQNQEVFEAPPSRALPGDPPPPAGESPSGARRR